MSGVLITGAAKRLGAEMARHLARQGHAIVVHYHQSTEQAENLIDELRQTGIRANAIQADLSDRHATLGLIDQAISANGEPLDILINNASTILPDRVDDNPSAGLENWDMNMATNIQAPFLLSRAFADQCSGHGQIINMIDQKILRPTPNFSSYTLAKSALWTLTKTSAMALGPSIRVNAIAPGTTLKGENQSDDQFNRHRDLSVLKTGANPHDILQALDYLLTARVVTGQMIAVDGGQHLIWQLPSE